MRFSQSTLAATLAAIGSVALLAETEAFVPQISFVRSAPSLQTVASGLHKPGCPCSACTGIHSIGCDCPSCSRGSTALFADATEEAEVADEVPVEVAAMDGVESAEEAHNTDRPARNSLKKKTRSAKGTPLSEFEVGSMVKATVKSVTSYGAFCDFGGASDGLLHISRMSKEFVNDVNELVSAGQELEVRLVDIDIEKNQVALSLLTAEEEQAAKDEAAKSRQNRRERQQQNQGRRDNSALLAALEEKGFDSEKFVPGKVVSTVAFGAFVRVNAKQLNEEVEGEFDGLVHISALTAGRASSVTAVVNVNDDVQVRVRSIGDGKVSLSMISVEDEAAQAAAGAQSSQENFGAKDWKDSLEKMQKSMPVFENRPLVVDLRQ